jgi:hypothetical protein
MPSGTELKITGANYYTTGYAASVYLAGVKATSVVINSATEVVATFEKGLPPFTGSLSPQLQFQKTDSSERHDASGTATVSNSLTISAKSTGMTCSFNGGCPFSVTANGLASLLAANPEKNYIEVCNKKCPYSSADSTTSDAKCLLPPISTIYSDQNFAIQDKSEDLRAATIFGSMVNPETLFDNNNLNYPTLMADPECHVGVGFSAGFVGMIS